jgi:hypothetical protein
MRNPWQDIKIYGQEGYKIKILHCSGHFWTFHDDNCKRGY